METSKLTLALALLVIALLMTVFSLFTFTSIDNIINNDLYQHGLQFDYKWARPYWDYSSLFSGSLTIAILLIIISIASILIYTKKNKSFLKYIGYAFPLAITSLNAFSYFIFTRIDYLVHNNLYNYGLQFSLDWTTPYYTYATSLLALTLLASTITLTTPLLIHFNARQEVKPKTVKKSPAKLTYSILITTGTIALLLSIWYVSSILAFIGLGLLFWGILFAYIRTDEYTKKALLDTTAYSQTALLNQLLQELDYIGNPIYLPPKFFKNPETYKAYIPKQNGTSLPTPEQIQKQDQQLFIQKPLGILITPPGSELTKLFEKTLNTNFNRVDLLYLQQNMPKLLIEDLEIVNNFEMEIESNKISVKLENSVFTLDKETEKQLSTLSFPLGSAIACALAKTTGNSIIIEKQQISQNSKAVTIIYRIMDEEAQTKP